MNSFYGYSELAAAVRLRKYWLLMVASHILHLFGLLVVLKLRNA